MIRLRHRILATASLMALFTTSSVGAQNAPAPLSSPLVATPQGTPQGSGWNSDDLTRQSFREEMEQIRKEHEDVEAAQDRLLDKCVNVSGAQATECEQEKQALHERREQMHLRMRALHEKMEASRKDRQDVGIPHGVTHVPPTAPINPAN